MKKTIVLFLFVLFLTGCSPKAVITLDEGMDTVEVFEVYQIRGCTVTVGENDYRMNVVNNPVDNDIVGEYIIEYEKEVSGKIYTCQRVVFIVDQTSPELILNPGIDTVYVGENWVDAGVEAIDNYSTEISVVVNESEVNILVEGSYEVYYTAIDDSGNESTITRVVHVIEGE